jgi:serine/threonine-protein kinase
VLLDFGIARAIASSGADRLTMAGMTLGTAAYMSPEQARGRAADKRVDIWSFGVVVFEMLTGRRLFAGETVSDTLAAVLRQEIDWRQLPPGTPAELISLLRRCLERDRQNRLHDIADARIVLDEIARGGAETTASRPAPASRVPRGLAIAAIAAAMAIGALGGWFARRTPAPDERDGAIRLSIPAITGVEAVTAPAMSADGTFAVFVVYHGGSSSLYLQRFDEIAPRPIERTEGAEQPFISTDGRWIGFRRHGLEKISIDGGDPLTITDTKGSGPGIVWLEDGRIVMTPNWTAGLIAVPAGGGTPQALTTPDASKGERAHWFPAPLPDGRHLLFTALRNGAGLNDADVKVLDLHTGEQRTIMPGAVAHFVAPGYLLFFRAGAYQAIRFDPDRLTTSGEAVRVMEDARAMLPDGETPFMSSAATSSLIYRAGPRIVPAQLTWVAAGGALEALPIPPRPYMDLSLAPDGHRAAVGVLDGGRYVIRLVDLARAASDDVLDLAGSNWNAIWNPDGHRLAFRGLRNGQYDAFVADLNGSGGAAPFVVTDRDDWIDDWMPGGSEALLVQATTDGKYPLYKIDAANPAQRVRIFDDGGDARSRVSPDGKWIAAIFERSSRSDVFVRSSTGEGPIERVSDQGAQAVAWSPKARELYYARPPDIFVVSYHEDGGRFHVDGQRLFAKVEGSDPASIFSVGPDGRILIDLPIQKVPPSEMRVVFGLDRLLESRLRR